ncbi:MAG: YIP1 family protein [Chitinispirillaceae bacterium]
MNCPKCGSSLTPFQRSCTVCGNITGTNNTAAANISKTGLLDQFTKILSDLFGSPRRFFSREAPFISVGTAFLFALFCGSLAVSATYLWQQLLPELSIGYLSSVLNSYHTEQKTSDLLLAPLSISFGLLFIAGILHLLLKLFRANKKNFSSTLKLTFLSEGAMLLSLLPYVGGLLSFVFGLNFIIFGISAIHGVSKSKTVLLILSPLILFSLIILGTLIATESLPSLLNNLPNTTLDFQR